MTQAATFNARRHPTALAIVVLMHGAALTALALAKMDNPGRTIFGTTTVDLIPAPKDPPKDPPPPPQAAPQARSVIDQPPRVIDPPLAGPTVEFTPQPLPRLVIPVPGPAPVAIPEPAPVPPPAHKVEPARARANLASYVSDADYPGSAIRNEEQGTTRFRLGVGPDGKVTECTVTGSSGSGALDSATCRLMKSRARFTPAHDSDGKAVGDSVSSAIHWVLPTD